MEKYARKKRPSVRRRVSSRKLSRKRQVSRKRPVYRFTDLVKLRFGKKRK